MIEELFLATVYLVSFFRFAFFPSWNNCWWDILKWLSETMEPKSFHNSHSLTRTVIYRGDRVPQHFLVLKHLGVSGTLLLSGSRYWSPQLQFKFGFCLFEYNQFSFLYLYPSQTIDFLSNKINVVVNDKISYVAVF